MGGGGGVFLWGGGLCGGSSVRAGVQQGGGLSAPGCGSFWGNATVGFSQHYVAASGVDQDFVEIQGGTMGVAWRMLLDEICMA